MKIDKMYRCKYRPSRARRSRPWLETEWYPTQGAALSALGAMSGGLHKCGAATMTYRDDGTGHPDNAGKEFVLRILK